MDLIVKAGVSAVLVVVLFLVVNNKSTAATRDSKKEIYSAFDSASWAITSNVLSPLLGAHKQSLYDDFIVACDDAIAKKTNQFRECQGNDEVRLSMNRDQPSSVYNYTKEGYTKIRVPTDLYDFLKEHFDKHRHLAETEWKEYNVYHNAWEAPTTIVNLNENRMGGSASLTSKIEEEVRPILENWTGQRLKPVSTYGIRLYHNRSILAPHVDRMPLVISSIIQIDQDVDEPWPLEVYGHDGISTNVTMEPGDMVLYESHSVIHGRPFPMKGNFFANCFIHFEPYEAIDGTSTYDPTKDIPPYLISGSVFEKEWKSAYPLGWKGNKETNIRVFVAEGNTVEFEAMIRKDIELMHEADANGWTVLHEAARSGQLGIIKLILKYGGDKNLFTKYGVSPLNIALEHLDSDHELIVYFESIGAKNVSPYRSKRRHREL